MDVVLILRRYAPPVGAVGASLVVNYNLAARRCAQALGIALRGTVGLVLLAKHEGRIPSARPVIETLRSRGMFLSDAVIEEALSLVGEG